MKKLQDNSIDIVITDIPYGIDFSDWDVLHNNTNSALGGYSEHQKNNTTFKIPHRIPAYLSLEKIGGEQLKKERQGGRHKELELIRSKFTAANIVLSHYNQKWLSDRWSIPKEWREKINENIYNGKY